MHIYYDKWFLNINSFLQQPCEIDTIIISFYGGRKWSIEQLSKLLKNFG